MARQMPERRVIVCLIPFLAACGAATAQSAFEISKDGHTIAHIDPNRAERGWVQRGSGVPFGTTPDQVVQLRRQIGGLAIADVNGDGHNDLIAVCYISQSFPPYEVWQDMIFYGTGSGIDTTPGWLSAIQTHTGDVQVGDLNNDGFPDIVTIHGGSLRRDSVRVYQGQPGGPATTPSYISNTAATAWATSGVLVDDPLFPQQWALEQPNNEDMDALDAWAVTTGDPSIRVIVLDSGIEQNHPDLNQIPGQSFTGGGANGGPSNSCDNHGTAVAGCIAATINNGFGVVGIAPGVQVQSGKIFNEINFFNLFCLPFLESQDSWSASGINWAASSGAQITNSSWGGGSASPAIANAFNTTHAQGVIHFGAAGNDGTGTIGFPANLDSVLAVAALDSSGNRAGFSTYGPGLFISAPGAAVLTTDRSGTAGYGPNAWTTIDGTSFASPYAAGVAALVLSVDPALSPEQVADILAATAADKGQPGYDTGYGWGFIKAGAAVQAAAGSGCTADLTGDGSLNFFDLAAYLDLYNAANPAADIAAPFGVLNFFDLAAYLDLYNAGCP